MRANGNNRNGRRSTLKQTSSKSGRKPKGTGDISLETVSKMALAPMIMLFSPKPIQPFLADLVKRNGQDQQEFITRVINASADWTAMFSVMRYALEENRESTLISLAYCLVRRDMANKEPINGFKSSSTRNNQIIEIVVSIGLIFPQFRQRIEEMKVSGKYNDWKSEMRILAVQNFRTWNRRMDLFEKTKGRLIKDLSDWLC